jgi:hypothetical protein
MRTFFDHVPNGLLSWVFALAAVPLLVFVAGCDEGGGTDNTAPSASFTYTPETPTAGQGVTFDASESSDPDGDISSYEWTFGDGGSASGQEVTYTFEQDGNIRAELTVRDDGELSNSTAQTVTVGETTQPPPTMSANYDTTGRVITITETDAGEGIVPIDQDGNEIGDDAEVTWSSDFTYRLDGRVFVNEGQVLHIEPGTIIQGKQSKAVEDTGTLIVARGGQIDASGEPENPIVFTAEGDADPSSISPSEFEDRGFWGGVIVLGHAPNNVGEGGAGVNNVEGLGDLPRAAYGCGGGDFSCDEDDSSGTLEYVSIRFGGFEITPGNEINGLTMGSVGEGTTISHVEVASNLDDGFEWFGGTVNADHLVASFVGDDSYDIDQGYGADDGGDLQYLLAVQGYGGGNRAGEHDSGDDSFPGGEGSDPTADPQICNATYIGAPDGDVALKLRDNFGGDYFNSLFTGFPTGVVEIEDASGEDSRQKFESDELLIENNLAFDFPNGDSWSALVENGGDYGQTIADYLADKNALQDNLDGFGLSYNDDELSGVDPFPASGSAAFSGAGGSDCLEGTDYKGAFDGSGDNWADGWTAISQSGLLADN